MVAFAATRNFAALDAMIRKYQSLCDDLDDKPPEDKNGLYMSRVGNRWALKGDLDALSGATLKKAIDAATDKPDPDDPRTLAQRQAVGAVRLGRSFLDRGESPTEDGERPHIAITVPLESLLTGKFETTGDLSLASSQISELLCDSKLQVIVLGADGKPLDVGANVYRPSRRLRRAVLHRDHGRCRYPGCDRTHGQVHHVIAFPGGKTILVNLVFLCDYHHHVLHKPGWHATFDGTTFTVTNPGRHDHRERRRPRGGTARHVRRPPAREVRGHRARSRPQGRRHRRVALPRLRGPEHRAQRGGRPPEGGVRDRPDVLRRDPPGLLRRARPRARHERERHARLAELPEPARLRGPPLRDARGQGHRGRARAGVQRLAHRRVVRVRARSLHPARDPDDLGPRGARRRGAPRREEGLPRDHVPGEPGAARPARACTPTTGTRSGRRAPTRGRSSACTSGRRASS